MTVPLAWNTGFELAEDRRGRAGARAFVDVEGAFFTLRSPLSQLTFSISTGTTSSLKRPAAMAASALSCEPPA